MSCNVLHPQCWQQQRWIGAGGARNMHSGETLGGKGANWALTHRASAAKQASAVLPWGEKEGRATAAAAGLRSLGGGWCRCRRSPSLLGACAEVSALARDSTVTSSCTPLHHR